MARFQQADAQTLATETRAGRLPDAAQQAMTAFLAHYGMRGVGEIDLGRPRWRDDPTAIMQVLQSYLQIDPSQAPDAMFARGAAQAEAALEQLVAAVRHIRGGWWKARWVRFAGRRMRALAGLRESPKFFVIQLFGVLRELLLARGAELVEIGILEQADDVVFLTLADLHAVAEGDGCNWKAVVRERQQANRRERGRRQVPRLLLSDGEAFYATALSSPTGGDTLIGNPVSPGTVEGRVHVIFDPHGAQLAPGEILVCPATDPGWTPLFLAAGGLVMEVGGLMTHGSVVAREYGIPAVVGIQQATTRLQTGQRVRVDGSTGRVTLLAEA